MGTYRLSMLYDFQAMSLEIAAIVGKALIGLTVKEGHDKLRKALKDDPMDAALKKGLAGACEGFANSIRASFGSHETLEARLQVMMEDAAFLAALRESGREIILPPAPGDLRIVQAFVNTADPATRTDELASLPGLQDWLKRWGLAPAGGGVRIAAHAASAVRGDL